MIAVALRGLLTRKLRAVLTMIAIVLGVAILFAWLIERTDLWLRRLFFIAILIPMAIPNMIYAMAWIQRASPSASSSEGEGGRPESTDARKWCSSSRKASS